MSCPCCGYEVLDDEDYEPYVRTGPHLTPAEVSRLIANFKRQSDAHKVWMKAFDSGSIPSTTKAINLFSKGPLNANIPS